jgi:hypothetical protein
MIRRESLRRRLSIIARDGLSIGLDGCPVGGWPETQQAMQRLCDELPHRSERTYSVSDVVDALYTVDHADRYRIR